MLKQEQEDLLKAQRRLEQAVSFHSEVVLIRLFLWRLFGVDINKEIQRVEFHGQIFWLFTLSILPAPTSCGWLRIV